jgi:hypothetical protein
MIPFEKKGSVLQEKTSLFAPFPATRHLPDCQKVWDIFPFSGYTETNKSLCFPFPSAAVRSCPEGF